MGDYLQDRAVLLALNNQPASRRFVIQFEGPVSFLLGQAEHSGEKEKPMSSSSPTPERIPERQPEPAEKRLTWLRPVKKSPSIRLVSGIPA